jgi:serine protease AprX
MFGRHVLQGCALALLAACCLTPSMAAQPAQAASAVAAADWQSKVELQLLSAVQSGNKAEFVIQLGSRADLSAAARAKSKAEKGRIVFGALKADAQRSQAPLIATLKARGLSYKSFWIANAVVTHGSLADIEAVSRLASVSALTLVPQQLQAPAGRHREAPKAAASKALSTTAKAIEPSLSLVHAPEVWAMGIKGAGIVVGDHDIGVMWDHPALKTQYRGWDAATQTADHAYNWHNAFTPLDPFCPDLATPCDSNGHGTHTTGTMVGDDGAGMQVGMAPAAKWMACRSLLDPVLGVGTLPTYMDCMEWMIAPYPTGESASADPAMAPDVVNNSWGCLEGCAPPLLQDINEATEAAGILQVVSAGNDGDQCNTILFPLAVYDSSFTVGATDNSDAMASFSSRGAVVSDLSMRIKPNVVAPGVDTLSAWNDGDYNTISGTSMAGPHVAGLAALVLSAEPKLIGRTRDVRALIENTAVPIVSGETCSGTSDTDIPNNTWGYGRIDALAAIQGLPKLKLTATAPTSASPGTDFDYVIKVALPATAKIPATGIVVEVTLPTGVTLSSSSATATGTAPKLSFAKDSLEPGTDFSITLKLRSADAGKRTVNAKAEADQSSAVTGNATSTTVGSSSGGGSGGGGGGGGALGLGLLGLLTAAAAVRRRRP